MKASPPIGRRTLLLAGVSACLAPAAYAHRSQSVLTSITWNQPRKMLEVTHRIHTDDAEIGLAKFANLGEALDLGEVRSQARLLVYLESHFTLTTETGPIALEPVGVEPLGMETNAYQEAVLPAAPSELDIDNQILRDVFAQQTNLVNVRLTGRTRTLIFSGADETKRATNLG